MGAAPGGVNGREFGAVSQFEFPVAVISRYRASRIMFGHDLGSIVKRATIAAVALMAAANQALSAPSRTHLSGPISGFKWRSPEAMQIRTVGRTSRFNANNSPDEAVRDVACRKA